MCIYIQLMKKFDVPDFYRSNLIGAIKNPVTGEISIESFDAKNIITS